MTEYFTIESQEGERIDRYLSEELEDKSRSYIQKLIRDGHVLVDGKTVKAGYRLVAGDNIAITLPEIKEPEIPAENIPLDILYEDKDLLVVNKPKQMVVHPAPGHYTGTAGQGADVSLRTGSLWNQWDHAPPGLFTGLTWIPQDLWSSVKQILHIKVCLHS